MFRSPIPDANCPRRPGWREAESIIHHETGSSGMQDAYLKGPPSPLVTDDPKLMLVKS